MEFHSWLIDYKVRGVNVSVDVAIGEYLPVALKIIENNEMQRRRVSSRGKPYQLLQRDLIEGCIMPPIILALSQGASEANKEPIERVLEGQPLLESRENLMTIVRNSFDAKELLILDGLQRTYTLKDCVTTLESSDEKLAAFYDKQIRLEIYLGLSKVGILYRMLTLNTGQTPMSFRHQIEILYSDYLTDPDRLDGIEVLKEVDERRARGAAKYKFSDVVDMYYAFTTGRPESIDKQSLVNQLAEIDFLEGYRQSGDDLEELLLIYNQFIRRIEELSDDWEFPLEPIATISPPIVVERPFGRTVSQIFERVQPMTAFGAECQRLIKQGQVQDLQGIRQLVALLHFEESPGESLTQLVVILDEIAKRATKIGTAQRELLQYAFRALLNSDSESYRDLSACWLAGQERYQSLN